MHCSLWFEKNEIKLSFFYNCLRKTIMGQYDLNKSVRYVQFKFKKKTLAY